MPTSGQISSRDTDRGAKPTYCCDSVLFSSSKELLVLDSCTNLHCWSRVRALCCGVGIEVLNIFVQIRPNREGTTAEGATIEVMAGIFDHESKIEVASKVDGELNVGDCGGIDLQFC